MSRAHDWEGGECQRCYMRAGWPGERDVCNGPRRDAERMTPARAARKREQQRERERAEARR
jgi:hypothetical protein